MRIGKASNRILRRRAFTLIEFIVVMTIIGILAAMIIPKLFRQIGGAKQAVAKQKIAVLETSLGVFQGNCGRLPTNQEALQALIRAPQDVADQWKGPYVKEKDLLDPWGNEFKYESPGRHNTDFDLYTLGADGQEGGDGENQDIGNW